MTTTAAAATSAQLRERWRRGQDAILAGLARGGSVLPALRSLARVTDGIVRTAAAHTGVSRFAAVAAIGGYGRGELFPYSDVDLLIVPALPPAEAEQNRIAALVQLLWDTGLAVGHAVRSPAECVQEAQRDVTVMTALLEGRQICGPKPAFEAVQAALRSATDARAFLRAKLLEQRQRHAKFEDTPYALEPNCKESPGGLRDLQMLLWVARAADLGSTWEELTRNGLITTAECAGIRNAERLLKRVRAHLHAVAGRREDRLVFDLQHALAVRLGIAGTSARRASEVLMQRVYRAAKTVTQINTLVLLSIEQRMNPGADFPPQLLDEAFCTRADLLDLRDDDGVFERDPAEILRAFLVLERHPECRSMTPRMLRAIWNARGRIDGGFRRTPANRARFLAILQEPQGVLHTLRRMNDWSVLGRYLPPFRRIVGQMQHDLFHVYTVDQHILMVVRNLRRFASSDYAHEHPECSQLVADFERPWLLTIAALFHDIAKGRGGDHSTLGAREARRFCLDHGLSQEDTALVAFLVQHHLTMSQVAQKQDLADPAVVAEFARTVGTDRRLVALYLLTVADIRGTSPKVWNAWKARLLETLFRLTRRSLGGQTLGPEAELEGRKREARRILGLYGISETAHEPLWRELDVVYFLRNAAPDIAWHTRCLLVHVHTDRTIVRTRLAPAGEGIEVLLYARDRKDLFLRVCGYFESRRISILDAKIHTTRHGYALDTFVVVDQSQSSHFRTLLASVEQELATRLTGSAEPSPPNPGRLSRQSRHFPVSPAVYLEAEERPNQYRLSLVATDRVGLLYAVAQVLARHHADVLTAKILTLGERVEDVFRIESPALENPRAQLQLENELLEALAP